MAGPSRELARAAAEAAAAPTTDDAVYAYDAAGRMVGVTDPDGETARYRYDAAGNRLGIDRFASSSLSVLSLVPVRAAVGQTVTLSGTGFSTTPASNAVKFGAVPAEVVSASAHRLVVKVPAGAPSAKVSVSVGASNAESAESFTLAGSAPTVSKVEPDSGVVGSDVVLTGSGFAAGAADNVVRFGGGVVGLVKAVTGSSLTVTVPQGAVNGEVSVQTRDGRGVSPVNYRVLFGSGEGQIESSVTTSVTDATAPSVAVTTPGNRAQVLFDANQGDDIDFGFTGSTFNSGVTGRLYDPEGNQVGSSFSITDAAEDGEANGLPLGGRYSLILDPGSENIGAMTVTVSNPASSALDLAGAAAELSMARAGQDGKVTFDASLGQAVSLAVDAAGMAESSTVRLFGPDGLEVDTGYAGAGDAVDVDVDALAKSGTYTLRIDPNDGGTGTAKVTGSHYLDAGVLDPAGPAAAMDLSRAGQNGLARFAGLAGERFQLGMASTGFASYTSVEVYGPDGVRLDYETVSASSSSDFDVPALPATGTYTVRVDPPAAQSGTIALTLSKSLSAAGLSTTGGAVDVAIGRFGQNAESVFQGTAGQTLSLAVVSNTFTEYSVVEVFAPSGTRISQFTVSAGRADTLEIPALPQTGAYRVVVDPDDGGTGSLSLSLSADAAVSLAVDGASVPVALGRPGQRARAAFTAPAGGALGFALTGVSLNKPASIRLIGPSGGSGDYVGTVSSNSDDVFYLKNLTPNAAYTLVVTPQDAGSGNATLWLSAPVAAGTLTTAPKTAAVTRPGQRLEFVFDAAAGDGTIVALTGVTLGSGQAFHVAPGTSTETTAAYINSDTATADLLAPLPAGTHRIIVQPSDPKTGAVTAALVPDAAGGALSVGGAKKPAAISTAGQNAHYTFAGTTGQKLRLVLDAPPYYWYLTVTSPNGTKLVDDRSLSSTALYTDLPALPATGTYTIAVNPWSLRTGTWNVGLTTTPAPLAAAGKTAPKTAAAPKTTTDTAPKTEPKTEPRTAGAADGAKAPAAAKRPAVQRDRKSVV